MATKRAHAAVCYLIKESSTKEAKKPWVRGCISGKEMYNCTCNTQFHETGFLKIIKIGIQI